MRTFGEKSKRTYTYMGGSKKTLRSDLRSHTLIILLVVAILWGISSIHIYEIGLILLSVVIDLIYSEHAIFVALIFTPLLVWGIISTNAYTVALFARPKHPYFVHLVASLILSSTIIYHIVRVVINTWWSL